MDNYFTSLRLFVCIPTLELTTFEYEEQKYVTQIHYHRGQIAAKIRNVATLNGAAHIKRKSCATYMAS